MRSRSPPGLHFSTRSGERRCQWRRTDRWCRPPRSICGSARRGCCSIRNTGCVAYAPVYILAATGLYQMWRARRRAAPAGHRDHLYLRRAAADGRRIRHLVGRHLGAGPADRVGPAAVDAADRRRVPIRAGRIAAAGRAAPAAVDRRRHRDHARDRAGRPAHQQRARRHVGAARFLVAALGAVVAGAELHRPALDDRVAAHDVVAGDRRRRGGAAVEDAQLARRRVGARRIRHVQRRADCWSRSRSRGCRRTRRGANASISARGRGSPRSTASMRGRGPRRSSTTRCARAPRRMRCRELVLGVKPLQRSDPQPVRVIHNGRFSLPAGTYDVAVQFNDRPPDRAAAAVAADRPQRPAAPDLDAAAAAGRAMADDAVAAGRCELRRPARSGRARTRDRRDHHHADRRRRCRRAPARAGRARGRELSGARRCTFTTSSSIPKPQGFWTIGGQVVAGHGRGAARPDRAGRAAHASGREAEPRDRQHVRLAALVTIWCRVRRSKSSCRSLPSGVVPLTIAAETGFYPRDIDPQSTDRRFLGVWVEVKTGPAATP